jgi:hypothetical protein
VDYALIPREVEPRFSVTVLADTQPENWTELMYVADGIVAKLPRGGRRFVTVLGDVMFDDLSLYDPYDGIMARLGSTVRNVHGNHDMNYDAVDDLHADETWERHYGPTWYAFDEGAVHFVVLDTIIWEGRDAGRYTEGVVDRELEWLSNDLATVPRDRLIVLMMHAPLMLGPYPGAVPPVGVDRVLEITAGRRVLALAGHTHTVERAMLREGSDAFEHLAVATACGAWWSGPRDPLGIPTADQPDGVPNGWTVVDFDGAGYRLTYVPADGEGQLRVIKPAPSDTEVVADVFFGWEKWTVEAAWDDGPFAPMTQRPGKDPLALDLYEGPSDFGKPWVDATTTRHLWVAPIPTLATGFHRVTVRATDETGRSWETAATFAR